MEERWGILFFLTLVAAQQYGPVTFQSDNREYFAFSLNPPPPVLRDGLKIDTKSPGECPYELCLTYLVGISNDTLTLWPSVCKFYKQLNGTETFYFLNQPGVYQGLIYLNPRLAGECTIDISFSGTSCASGNYGQSCVTPGSLPLQLEFEAGSEIYFQTFVTPSNIRTFTVTANVSQDPNGALTLSYREGDLPRLDVFDLRTSTTSQELNLILPLPRETTASDFNKLFSLQNSGANIVTVSVFVTQIQCSRGFYGDQCQFFVNTCDRGKSYTIGMNSVNKGWYYCSVDFSKVSYFNIGVTSLDSGFSPQLYIRYGSIPSPDQFDSFSNDSTKDPRFYFSGQSVPTDGLWYVGIYGATSSFGLWFEDDCPSECSGNGKCDNHRCSCSDGWSTFDCSQQNANDITDKIQNNLYLIIGATIAGLVLLVLIYVYYRYTVRARKTRGYEYLGSKDAAEPKGRQYDSLTIGSL